MALKFLNHGLNILLCVYAFASYGIFIKLEIQSKFTFVNHDSKKKRSLEIYTYIVKNIKKNIVSEMMVKKRCKKLFKYSKQEKKSLPILKL